MAENVISVPAEREGNAAKPAEHSRRRGRTRGANAVQNIGLLTANERRLAKGEDHRPKVREKILTIVRRMTTKETPPIAEQRGIAKNFLREGDDEFGRMPPAKISDRDTFEDRDFGFVGREHGMDLDAQAVAQKPGDFAAQKCLREHRIPLENVGDGGRRAH